jgi:ABC-type polysaccharide/polyol phosphate transport system ATPase subunit
LQTHFDDSNAVVLRGLSKRYYLNSKRPWRLAQALLNPTAFFGQMLRGEPFWALQDVSLTIRRGEFVAIVGPNGSGKSTLLGIIMGISPATRGTVMVNGKIAGVLELGAGFDIFATGRENAFVNALILGLSRRQAEEKMPEIIRFAELEDFIDQPVRTYSSGMTVRLAFSVAVHVRPEILLVDEVLAVGDADFQEKCFAHFEALKKEGTTVVLVSHDLNNVRRFADRAILLERGRVAADGEPKAVVDEYLTILAEKSPAIRRAIERAAASESGTSETG